MHFMEVWPLEHGAKWTADLRDKEEWIAEAFRTSTAPARSSNSSCIIILLKWS